MARPKKALTKKPIIDLGIYTKNRNFKVPGSSKYHGFHRVPLPSYEFSMATRMADRLRIPDLTTEQLNLKGEMTIRASALFPKEQIPTKKRQLVGSYSGEKGMPERGGGYIPSGVTGCVNLPLPQ